MIRLKLFSHPQSRDEFDRWLDDNGFENLGWPIHERGHTRNVKWSDGKRELFVVLFFSVASFIDTEDAALATELVLACPNAVSV
jgi:hypothetical protein